MALWHHGTDVVQLTNLSNGGAIMLKNNNGDEIVQMYADEYGNGLVGAYNRKGRGRTLQPGP